MKDKITLNKTEVCLTLQRIHHAPATDGAAEAGTGSSSGGDRFRIGEATSVSGSGSGLSSEIARSGLHRAPKRSSATGPVHGPCDRPRTGCHPQNAPHQAHQHAPITVLRRRVGAGSRIRYHASAEWIWGTGCVCPDRHSTTLKIRPRAAPAARQAAFLGLLNQRPRALMPFLSPPHTLTLSAFPSMFSTLVALALTAAVTAAPCPATFRIHPSGHDDYCVTVAKTTDNPGPAYV